MTVASEKGKNMESNLPAYTVEELQDIGTKEAAKFTGYLYSLTEKADYVQDLRDDLAGAFVQGALLATVKIRQDSAGKRSYQWKTGKGFMLKRLAGIRREEKSKNVSLSTVIDEEEGETLADTIGNGEESPAEAFGRGLDLDAARQVISSLDDRERALLMLRFVDNKTMAETAEALGISQGRVCQIEKEIMPRLKKKWEAA